MGELFVFVFFGLVATVGTSYAAVERVTGLSVVLGCAVGALACALLVINNLRDIPTDREVGKRTLAVRLGDAPTRRLYVVLLAGAFALLVVAAVAWRPAALLGLAAAPLAVAPARTVLAGATGPALIPVLGATGRLQMAFGLAATIGLVIGG
jgi:1,4-dihydroxy-2-naphthoate octaprenyltransferase